MHGYVYIGYKCMGIIMGMYSIGMDKIIGLVYRVRCESFCHCPIKLLRLTLDRTIAVLSVLQNAVEKVIFRLMVDQVT